jgi:pilus assembly protein CpaB
MSNGADSPESRAVRKSRVRAIIFFMLAVVAGLAGVVLFVQYMDRVKEALPRAAADTQPVVTAAMDVPIAIRLEAKHLVLTDWPRQQVPEGSFRKIEGVVGRTVRQSLVKGEPLLAGRLADEKRGQGMAALLDPGVRAMAVGVGSVVGVAGFVQPGDVVDVITIMKPDTETRDVLDNEAATISKIVLQNIKVLAVGGHMATKGRKPVKVKVVTLAVTPGQSERLALATRYGSIQLVIRSRIDQAFVPTAGVTPLMLLAPDEGAEVWTYGEKEPVVVRRRPRRPKVEEKPRGPESSTVEIIRGTRVEKRRVRSYETTDKSE